MAWTSQQMGQVGLSFASQIGGFIAASKQAKADKAWQKYNNTMTKLSNSINQDVLTTNENIQRRATLQKRASIRKSEYTTLASASVAAAASGTIGRSVNSVMHDIKRNAALADAQAAEEFEMVKVETDNQRMQASMQTQMSLDLRKIQGPNPIALALGLMGSAQDLWQS